MFMLRNEVLDEMMRLTKKDRMWVIREMRARQNQVLVEKRSARNLKLRKTYDFVDAALAYVPDISDIQRTRSRSFRQQFLYKENTFFVDVGETSFNIIMSVKGVNWVSSNENNKRIIIGKTNTATGLAKRIFNRVDTLYRERLASEVVNG